MLVVDETDRLLRQDYQNWLPAVLQQITPPPAPPPSSPFTPHSAASQAPTHASLPPPSSSAAAAAALDAGREQHASHQPLLPFGAPRPIKLIVSATLTRDPSKLSRLQLHCPRFISLSALGGRRYALPAGLALRRVLAPAQHKPLALVALLHRLKGVPTLVFASSVETTHRWGLGPVLFWGGGRVGSGAEGLSYELPWQLQGSCGFLYAGDRFITPLTDPQSLTLADSSLLTHPADQSPPLTHRC